MAFSEKAKDLLRDCAEAMAQGEGREVNLYEIFRYDFHTVRWEILIELKSLVEEISGGKRTVTMGTLSLFGGEVVSPGFHLVVHDFSDRTISGIIRELKDDMVLYILGPYENGLSIGERVE